MNMLGKILTGLIALFSVLFMALAMAVYAAHINWKNLVTDPQKGLQVQLKQEKDRVTELNNTLEQLKKDREAEKIAHDSRVKALDEEKGRLTTERDKLSQAIAGLDAQQRAAVAAMTSAQANMKGLDEQVKQLQQYVRDAEKKQNDDAKLAIKLTEQMHQLASDLKQLKDRNTTLVADLAKYRLVLNKFNLKPNPEAYTGVAPPVDGHILAVTEPGSGPSLVEISVGNDVGIEKGHQLEIVRLGDAGPTYLGKVEVIETKPDRAVAKVLPNFQKGTIQKGDHVASQSRLQ